VLLKSVKRELHVIVALFVLASAFVGFASTSVAGASSISSAFYLDIGASASLGYQPTPSSPHGQHTDSGYADYLVAHEAAKGITLQLSEIGCDGETTVTMLVGGDSCYASPNTQLDEAVDFLTTHHDDTGLVTIDLGFNDIMPCLSMEFLHRTCLKNRLELVREQLPIILRTLKAAAGPDVVLMGVGHYDPYLADALQGTSGEIFAEESHVAIAHLEKILLDDYSAADVPMVDVGAAFNTDDSGPISLTGVGTVPDNVAEVCLLTWMCQTAPYGPNIHPNDAGYEAIADAIAAQLPAPW
jgi:lysophospholipase L1-like esterase